MNADQKRVAVLTPLITSKLQALNLLDQAMGTAADVAVRASDLPLIDGGSRATIADGVNQVLDYANRIYPTLHDPPTELEKKQVALVVAQLESWLSFVDNEVKSSPGFLAEWAGDLPTVLHAPLDAIEAVGKTAGNVTGDILGGIPWPLYVVVGLGLIVATILLFKKGGAA